MSIAAESDDPRALVKTAIQLTREQQYERAVEIFDEHLAPLTKGTIADRRLAASAFSFYGVCTALAKHRYSEGVKYCEISLNANFLDPNHRHNLALIYLARDDRKRAVETLDAGLRLEPDHQRINQVYQSIGRRGRPVFPFLARSNPINVWFGKLLSSL